jgi:hypothetical protein
MKTVLLSLFLLFTLFAWSQNPSSNPSSAASVKSADVAPVPSSGKDNTADIQRQAVETAKAEQKAADSETLPEPCLSDKANLNAGSVADQISLYYFSDVSRLMSLLNPKTRKIHTDSLVLNAASKRRALLRAELELTKTQSEVNRLQADLQQKEERLRQSEARFALSQALLDKASANQARVTQDQTRAADRLSKTQKNADDHPNDLNGASELSSAKLAKDKADEQLLDANKKQAQANSEHEAAQTQVTNDRDTQNGLARKIEDAKSDLEKTQKDVADQRGNMLLAAADEMESFTQARDNATYWCAPGDDSSDPARRVTLFAFDDSKTIFLRGQGEDVQAVESIIAQFDRPAPQARLSLWTLELNSDATKSGTDKLNETLQIVEEELADTRVRLAGSVSALRDSVLEEVNRREGAGASRVPQEPSAALRRAALYDKELLLDLKDFRQSLPDPAVVTTLGESLVALSLADKDHRVSILNNFRKRLLQQFGELRVSTAKWAVEKKKPIPDFNDVAFKRIQDSAQPSYSFTGRTAQTTKDYSRLSSLKVLAPEYAHSPEHAHDLEDAHNLEDFANLFPATMRALGLGGTSAGVANTTSRGSPQFAELKQAFTRVLIGRQLDRLSTQLAEADSHEPPPNGSANSEAAERRRKRLHKVAIMRLAAALNFIEGSLSLQLYRECGFKLEKVHESVLKTIMQDDKVDEAEEENIHTQAAIAITCLKDLYPAKSRSAREAAANEMLKQMIVAYEDDLDRHFIRPMIKRIRTKVNGSKGLSVGVVQRTSLLATNRLRARVDPRGSAQLGLGQDQDILGAVTQLAQLYAQGQTLGPVGMLPALQALPHKPGPELYAVNTGAEFKVTPIFDPSGQALRFQLDYIAANRVQEPIATKNPQLSRIERHTINTEVQLSNMELREVTRFESDAALGIPTRKSGGIPLLNEIPGIKEIPLIGYFVRHAGHNAVMQESIIFGQTTTYPTISDLLGLEIGSDLDGGGNPNANPNNRSADINSGPPDTIATEPTRAATPSSELARAPVKLENKNTKSPQ